MRQLDLKKLLLPNLPYLLIGLYATKLGEAWRLAPGADASAKLLGLMDGFAAAFQSALPSFHPVDLLVGLCCGAALRLAVYFKGKNAKKYRKNMEYGSARWRNWSQPFEVVRYPPASSSRRRASLKRFTKTTPTPSSETWMPRYSWAARSRPP